MPDDAGRLFQVIWADTGLPVADLREVALRYRDTWTKRLVYSDMQGFCVDEDGLLILIDECGNYGVPPPGLFSLEWLL